MGDVLAAADERPASSRPAPGRRRRGLAVIAWVLVACWALIAIARLAGADRVPGLDRALIPLMAALPYAAAGVVLPILVAALTRTWAALAAAVAVAVVFGIVVLPSAVGTGGGHADGPRLRVLTANLLFGAAGNDRLVRLVRSTGADVLSVQEFTPEAAHRLDAAGLGRLLPYNVLDPRPGPSGSGLYARYPLTPVRPAPRTTFAMPVADLAVPGGPPVRVTVAHPLPPLGPGIATWTRDLRQIPRATPHGRVRIVAGDLNGTLDHARLRELIGTGYVDAARAVGAGLRPTFRSLPPITIDHVLADRRCAVRAVTVYGQPDSDHRAVLADLRLP